MTSSDDPTPARLEIRKSRRTSLILLVGSTAGFLFLGACILKASQDTALFAFLAAIALVFMGVAALNLADRSVQVALDDTELVAEEAIPLDAIRRIRYHDDSLNVGHFVEVDLDGGRTIRITTAGSLIALELTASELYEAIKARMTPPQLDQLVDEGALDGNTLESSVLTGEE